tara:strand:- start:523 stop:1065 length:543 start_codon:yes stop_codon:yes gene_type:complete
MWRKRNTAFEELIAKDQIRELVHNYSVAIANRNHDLMITLFDESASFGSYGSGKIALRSLMEKTMDDLEFAVIFVNNHTITIENSSEASGEVWAKCYAQSKEEGYYEQIVKYEDQYRKSPDDADGKTVWKFINRRHLLWFGESRESPLLQPEARWPIKNIGVGRIPLADERVQAFRSGLD